jgi:hypothetical protein
MSRKGLGALAKTQLVGSQILITLAYDGSNLSTRPQLVKSVYAR